MAAPGVSNIALEYGVAAPKLVQRTLGLLLFASIICAAGMYANSTTAVIGSMLVSPIGGYLINASRATIAAAVEAYPVTRVEAHFGRTTTWVAVAAAMIGMPVAVGLLAGGIQKGRRDPITDEMRGRSESIIESPGTTLVTSAIVALAGAALFAWAGTTPLVGVGIATALLPPLVCVGMRLARGDLIEAGYASGLFTINALAIYAISLVIVYTRSSVLKFARSSVKGTRDMNTFNLTGIAGALNTGDQATSAL